MTKIKKIFQHLKTKWGIRRDFDVILILVVFAITGSLAVRVGDLLYTYLGFDQHSSVAIWIFVRVILIFPLYQVLLLMVGFVFGQFRFFWDKEKKMMKWFGRMLRL